MKSINLFILNLLLIGGLTIPTCNKAKAAEHLVKSTDSKVAAFNPPLVCSNNHFFKNYPN
jgi:hypothetical protein